LSDHTTADDANRYRPAAELEAAWKREPLLRIRQLLVDRHGWTEQEEAALRTECMAKIDAAVAAYQSRPRPSTDAMFDQLYANLPEEIALQRALARQFDGH
jgi:2-oxoisovalerate dehydrogenase E1 component alpha subunit